MTVEAIMRMLAASGSYQNYQNGAPVERPDPQSFSGFSYSIVPTHGIQTRVFLIRS
jgi:hypothetical protein